MNLRPSEMLLYLDVNQNGTRRSCAGELVAWLICMWAHKEADDSDTPISFGSEVYVITDAWLALYAAHGKCINKAKGINTRWAFSRSLTDLQGNIVFFHHFLVSVSPASSRLRWSRASTGSSQGGFGSLFPRKQARCCYHDNGHRPQRRSARAR